MTHTLRVPFKVEENTCVNPKCLRTFAVLLIGISYLDDSPDTYEFGVSVDICPFCGGKVRQ